MKTQPLHILMVDDVEDDFRLAEYACAALTPPASLKWLKDGAEAIAFLSLLSRNLSPEFHPNLLLLDLKIPGVDGFEVLQWLRENPRHAIVPTIVYSSSDLGQDVHRAYQLGAHAVLTKPANLDLLQAQFGAMQLFWSFCERPEAHATSLHGAQAA